MELFLSSFLLSFCTYLVAALTAAMGRIQAAPE